MASTTHEEPRLIAVCSNPACQRRIDVKAATDCWNWTAKPEQWTCHSRSKEPPTHIASSLKGCEQKGFTVILSTLSGLEPKKSEIQELKQTLRQAIATIEMLPPSYGGQWKLLHDEEWQAKPPTADASTQTDLEQ
jgi:hypothetical protein